ncbi:hypothetical protein MVEN_01149300 [Mycena venus]|uniref:F-box domain-containing protein n=1 Tax=Mycena venus TaxID=2733690 RepID=A0A8H6Y4Y0_9AGAR|nr:hypothetical protein MVEN_01149300 [Mycena venus]
MGFWPVDILWNIFPSTSQPFPNIPFDGCYVLPVKLWDCIFLHLDDSTLFVAAAVCRLFNERCIHITLLRNRLEPSDMAAGNYSILSHLLPFLLRALFIPTIKNLSCVFEESNLLIHLRLVSGLVAQSSNLDWVDLQFPFIARDGSRRRLLDAAKHHVFRTVLSSMLFTRWPWRDIILVSEYHFLPCPIRELFRYLTSEQDESVFWKCIPIARISSWKLYFQQTRVDGLRPFTMLVINESTTNQPFQTLTLGFDPIESRFNDYSRSRLTVSHLSAILAKLTLPHLQSLIIRFRHIDPSALRDFLIRHPQIRFISDKRPRAGWDAPLPRNPLFHPPLAMPNLRRIEGETTADVLSLLVLTAPSLPCTISFAFDALHRGETDARASLFRHISHRNIPTELEISGAVIQAEPTEADLALAQTLHCVEAVSLTYDCITESPALFPWLNSLPALSHVGIITWYPDHEDLTFARASLNRPGTDLRVEAILPPREARYSF